jgi:hypothetical protein
MFHLLPMIFNSLKLYVILPAAELSTSSLRRIEQEYKQRISKGEEILQVISCTTREAYRD